LVLLIDLQHTYFDLLQNFSRGRTLTIFTEKKLKKLKKKVNLKNKNDQEENLLLS
jgi:hypothetical protein